MKKEICPPILTAIAPVAPENVFIYTLFTRRTTRTRGWPNVNEGASLACLRNVHTKIRLTTAALIVLLPAVMAQAADDSSGKPAGDSKDSPRFLFELKR